MRIKILVISLLGLALSSCYSVTRQPKRQTILDASQESTFEGTGTSSADIRSMAEKMAREISAINWPGPMRIAITKVDNQTRFAINPNIIKNRLLTDLVELSDSSKFLFTENPEGAGYFLSVEITSLTKATPQAVSDYLVYTFKLVDKADTLIWARAYERKKEGHSGVMQR